MARHLSANLQYRSPRALAPLGPWASCGFVTGVILWELLTTPRVTGETLYGAIVGYLFTGIVFGMLYMLVEQLVPGSFRFGDDPARRLAWVDTSYFSFVTLTTIGYGDLVPLGEIRGLVLLEGIIGAMYPPILIGRLLASYQPRRLTEEGAAAAGLESAVVPGNAVRLVAASALSSKWRVSRQERQRITGSDLLRIRVRIPSGDYRKHSTYAPEIGTFIE